ncbi:hypothetical protein MCG98_16530 [Ruminococcus sp. OA3]|uniref:phage minor capsid protein n=1 Tax=Ruminococcus sp. OA3 TaxID=2914164 RepID=UPI001F062389|nr:phage minor capsid protein [Ruminococcus sp. OA3]MCH1984174.1 hypothetical protein [Ruminococcus sp. OA3]
MTLLENQRAADIPAGMFQDLEEQLMANIIRHCKDYNEPIASDEWLMRKLAEIGKLNQENIKIIAKSTGVSQTAMEWMLNEMAEKVLAEIEPGMRQLVRRGLVGEAVPAPKSKNVKQVLTTMQGQAKDTLNLCNTTMLYKARDAYKKLVGNIASTADEIADKQQKLDILNKHATSAVIGAESRQQALRKCIREFNYKGIPAFVDRRGREWTPEAYINMAMRSTSNTMAAEIQMARADDYGLDLVEVDSHSGARPKCARDQGKIFDRANKSTKYPHWKTSSYGEPDGLLGINCGHHIFPYMEGVSIRRYFPMEDLGANDKLYRETQVQRALERGVRKQKRECMLYDEIGDKEAFEQAAVKLKRKEAELRSYVSGNNKLHRRKDREQVVGFDKSISARAIAADKASKKKYAQSHMDSAALYNQDKNAIIKTERFTKREDADKLLRPETEKVWPKLTAHEKKSAYKYTEGSGGFNRPLRGYAGSWDKFVGIGKVPLNNEHCESYISGLKSAIDKAALPKDMWLYRGSDKQSLAGLLGIEKDKIMPSKVDTLNRKFSGQPIYDPAFFSTGVAADAGFNDSIAYEILAPKGTKGIYAEPFSAFGDTNSSGTWDGKQKGSSVGSEAEFILQAGTRFIVKEIKNVSGKVTVVLEVLP